MKQYFQKQIDAKVAKIYYITEFAYKISVTQMEEDLSDDLSHLEFVRYSNADPTIPVFKAKR